MAPWQHLGSGQLKSVACFCSAFSVLFLLLGCFSPIAIRQMLHQGVIQAVVWQPDSPPEVDARFRGSAGPDANPDYFRVWLFNITNVADIRQGAKPRLAEVGPLVYLKRRVKVDVWWDRQGRVAVKEWDYHVFQPHLSNASLDANVTTLNLPLAAVVEVAQAASSGGPVQRALLDLLLSALARWGDPRVDGLFTTRTAGELVWGYEDALLARLKALLPSGYVPSSRVELVHNQTLEEALDVGNTEVINTGKLDLRQLWNMEVENGWSNVTSWGPNCTEVVTGTDAFQFRPGLTPRDNLTLWVADLYRSAQAVFLKEVQLHGVRLLRFHPDPAEGDPDPCHHQTITGLLNVTVPKAVGPNGNASTAAAHSVSILPSLPHLCQVDPWVAASLEGVRCQPDIHSSFLDVEPITGITMHAAKRVQLNSQITPAARLHIERHINTSLILPIFWAEEASGLSEQQARDFKGKVYWALSLAHHSRVGLWAAGGATLAVTLLAAGALLAQRRRHGADDTGEGAPDDRAAAGEGHVRGHRQANDAGGYDGGLSELEAGLNEAFGGRGPEGQQPAAGQRRQANGVGPAPSAAASAEPSAAAAAANASGLQEPLLQEHGGS